MDTYLTVAEAVKLTGKSRRTITRLAARLAQSGSDQVIHEKTPRGYIWRINRQRLVAEFGVNGTGINPSVDSKPSTMSLPVHAAPPEQYLAIAQQGYVGFMSMHQEVKQTYERLIQEKDHQIAALTQELTQHRKGFWTRLWGG